MINEESFTAVDAARISEHVVRPLYSSYCFARLPQTVRYLLTGEDAGTLPRSVLGPFDRRYRHVVLVLIDGFGWRFVGPRIEQYPFLKRFLEQGVVSKLTSQFPSTTAAHVTTINSELTPAKSGVFEWFYYEPLVDRIIAPLLFSFAGDSERNTLSAAGVEPRSILPGTTFYHSLRQQGVHPYVFQPYGYARSPYTTVMTEGAEVVPYVSLAEGLITLLELLRTRQERTYSFFYFDLFDAVCHVRGPGSPHAAAEIDASLTLIERVFHQGAAHTVDDTLLLVTADHGHMAIDPATTIYLNQLLPEIVDYIRTNRAGDLLVPAGSSRDMFLYIKPDRLDQAQALLAAQLVGRADVRRVSELVEAGYFGEGAPSEVLTRRMADLVILPYDGESVWWYEAGRFEQRYYGQHGGLSPAEMETILLALPYESAR